MSTFFFTIMAVCGGLLGLVLLAAMVWLFLLVPILLIIAAIKEQDWPLVVIPAIALCGVGLFVGSIGFAFTKLEPPPKSETTEAVQ